MQIVRCKRNKVHQIDVAVAIVVRTALITQIDTGEEDEVHQVYITVAIGIRAGRRYAVARPKLYTLTYG